MSVESSPNRTLNRFFEIINCFTEKQPVMSLTEIANQIGLPMSTTHRFVKAMQSLGLIQYSTGGRSYQLGYQLIRWGNIALASIDLRRIALPVMQDLVKTTGETAVLSVPDGRRAIWVEMVESRHNVRLASKVGQRLDLHAGASSKVLWAFLPPERVNQLLDELELAPRLPNTIVDKEVMKAELDSIRQRGYATSFAETDEGAMGVAAPVYNHQQKLVAGIGIVAPISRIPLEKVPQVAQAIVDAGRDLSKFLGSSVDGSDW